MQPDKEMMKEVRRQAEIRGYNPEVLEYLVTEALKDQREAIRTKLQALIDEI